MLSCQNEAPLQFPGEGERVSVMPTDPEDDLHRAGDALDDKLVACRTDGCRAIDHRLHDTA
jgi:hypothetical protein